MDSTEFFATHLAAVPVLGILRGLSTAETVAVCRRAWDHGVPLVEIPIQSPAALDTLRAVAEAGLAIGRPVGAGTVTTLERVAQAADAGAAFTVAPGTVPAVATESMRLGLPHLPGVATATDIGTALALGLHWQKMFPAAELGASWAEAQHGPFPEVSFVATGGIDAGNAEEFLAGGASAVAVTTALQDPAQLDRLARLRSPRAS